MKYLLVSLWLFGLSLLQGCGGEIVSSTTATPPSPPASLAITSSTPPSGTAGAAYAGSGFLLTASGGAAPYQWKWVPALGSSLPEPDLHLSPSGLISGTPQVGGTYDVIVTVTDASSPAAQVSTNYSVAIAGPPTFAITSGTPPNGTVGVDYGPMTTEYLSCVWSPVLGWHLVCTQCPSYASCASLPPCRGISPTPCLLTKQIFLGLHVHSRWRRAAVHLEWLRSACRTRCRSKQRANHRYPNNRGQLQLHDHGQRCGITTGSAECDLHYRYRDVINGGFTEKVSVMCPAQHLRRKLMTSSFATFRR